MTSVTVSSKVSPSFNVHNVDHIVVREADLINGENGPFYRQRIVFLDENGADLADLNIFTKNPNTTLDVPLLDEMEDSST